MTSVERKPPGIPSPTPHGFPGPTGYFPHIDGIRALAVLPVLLFHVFEKACPGGFAGVDVFFVISGYLIIGGILRDLERGSFTIREFYHRRIRRIMPAYVALVVGVFASGCAIYYAIPLVHLADASVMSTMFSANLYFWKLGNTYFAPDAHGNPLLHLWSLSIEEQFYLVIPLLCGLLWKLRRGWVAPVLAILAVLSFSIALSAVGTGKGNSAFYLLQYRAWELLAGSLLAMWPAKVPESMPNTTGILVTLLSSAGLAMVMVPYAVLSSHTPFPGLAALPSVLGTALLIRHGQAGWVGRFLSWRPFVATGKISYSLYLWHWPVSVFWRYAAYNDLNAYDYAGMVLLSFLLAYLSWRFVELPVRTSPAWTLRRTFAFAASGILVLVSLGTACVFGRGWPKLLHPGPNAFVAAATRQEAQFIESLVRAKVHRLGSLVGLDLMRYEPIPAALDSTGDFPIGLPGKPELLLVGDSHAAVLETGMDACLRRSGRSGFAMSRPSKDLFYLEGAEATEVLALLARQPEIKKVVLAEYWSSPVARPNRGSADESMFDQLESFSNRIREMGRTLFIVTDVPIRDYAPNDIAARTRIIPPRSVKASWDLQQSEQEYDRQQGEINRRLRAVCSRTGAVFVPVHLEFKKNNHYIAFDKKDGVLISLYKDRHHLSREGSMQAAPFIMSYLYPGDAVPPGVDPSCLGETGDPGPGGQPRRPR